VAGGTTLVGGVTLSNAYNASVSLTASNACLGVNNASPAYALDVAGDARVTAALVTGVNTWHTSTDAAKRLYFSANSTTYLGSAAGAGWAFQNSGGGIVVTIDSGGDVGASGGLTVAGGATVAGTLTAAGPLVAGVNVWHTSTDAARRLYFSANSTTYFGAAANAGWVFQSTVQDVASIDASGNVGALGALSIGGRMAFANPVNNQVLALWGGSTDVTSTAFYGFGMASSTMRYQVPSGQVHRWFEGATERMALAAGGSLGLGTAAPSYQLDVQNATGASAVVRVGTPGGTDGRLYLGSSGYGVGRGVSLSTATDANDVSVFTAGSGSVVLHTSSVERLRVTPAGLVGVNRASPAYTLDVNGDVNMSGRLLLGASTTVSLSNSAVLVQSSVSSNATANAYTHSFANGQGTELVHLDSWGNLYAANNVYANTDVIVTSDARVKTNLMAIEGGLAKVNSLRGYTYSRTDLPDKALRMCGLLAQDVQAVLPEAVHTDDAGMLSLAYGNVVALLVEATRDMTARVVATEDANRELAARVAVLESHPPSTTSASP
jgi:hypothetical protein